MASGRLLRPLTWVFIVAFALFVILLRRWIHHAQLETISVIVPPDIPAADVVRPPAAAIVARMALEVRDTLSPPRRPRFAVLTFDDGPFPVTTPVLLAQLKALRAPAVFFLIGRDSREQPAVSRRLAQAGMEIGNHTLTHPEMIGMPPTEQQREIAGGSEAIGSVTGLRPSFFRPPHGNFDSATIDAARAQGEVVALWDVDPGDWRSIPAEVIVASVTHHARSPAVILLHNGKEATIDALPRIVKAYRDAGFEFVTLTELRRRLSLDAINDPIRVNL